MHKKKALLHLGIHKTATTHIQDRLSNSHLYLVSKKIDYIPLTELRTAITNKIYAPDFLSGNVINYLKSFHNNKDNLLISDENLIGLLPPLYENNHKPYRKLKPNLRKIINALNRVEYTTTITITLRNYNDYFISRYCEYLRHNNFINFNHYYQNLSFTRSYWLELINDIRDIFPGIIKIADFQYFLEDEKKYMTECFDLDADQLNPADTSINTRRSKFSQEAYNLLQLYAQTINPSSTQNLMKILDSEQQSTTITPFMPFSVEQQQLLQERYLDDWQTLENLQDERIILIRNKPTNQL